MSQQYIKAAAIVRAVAEEKRSLKKFCHGKDTGKISRVEYLLACETLKFGDVLKSLFEDADINLASLDVDRSVFKVMAYELLFGQGKVQGGGKVKRTLVAQEKALRLALSSRMKNSGAESFQDLLPQAIKLATSLPKYIRVNEIAGNVPESVELIRSSYPDACLDEHIRGLVKLDPSSKGIAEFVKREIISCSFMNSIGEKHSCCHNISKFIIQDKASCMPAQVLYDEYRLIDHNDSQADFIDACAAPGNKTSQLASLLYSNSRNECKIFAFDKSIARSKLLGERMESAGAHNVFVQNVDFLQLNTERDSYSNVKYILLDPSCSGSGVIRALERVLEQDNASNQTDRADEQSRLRRLNEFQQQVISKAMCLPMASTIVYSTCSVHKEENEDVVASILAAFPDWSLKPPSCLSSWRRRGLPCDGLTQEQSSALVRCHPEDGMNGFFVALFVKTDNIGQASKKCGTSLTNSKCSELRTVDRLKKRKEADALEGSARRPKKTKNENRATSLLKLWKPKKRR